MDEAKHSPQTPPEGEWSYVPDDKDRQAEFANSAYDAPAAPQAPGAKKEVTWTAPEFIAHPKGPEWYAVFVIVTVLLGAVLYLFTRDLLSMIAILIMAAMFGVVAARQPRMLNYNLSGKGLLIGDRLHPYGEYRSFAIMDEDQFSSIVLLPFKRFAVPLSLYATPEDRQHIIEALATYLPLQPGGTDAVERLMHRIHF